VVAQVGVGGDVPLVGHDHPGLDGQHVAAVVPLLPLRGVHVLDRGQHGDRGQLQGGGDGLVHVLGRVLGDLELVAGRARLDRVRRQHAHARVLVEHPVVGHGEQGVQVHEGPLLRHVDGDQAAGGPGLEQPVGHQLHRLRGGPLAHPDQHRAVADDQDVTAFDGGGLGVGTVVPGLEVRRGEHRVPAVDGLVVDGLAHPGLLAHGVDRHPAVDPGRGVALVEQVRQRRQDEAVRVQGVEGDALGLRAELGDLALGDPAGQELGQPGRIQPAHRGPERGRGQRPLPARVEHPVQDPGPGLGDVQRLGQQVAVVVHGHAAVPQRAGEGVVLLLGPGHPEHVVEQQISSVVRGQPLQFEVRAVQDHLPQAADLGVNVEHAFPSKQSVSRSSYAKAVSTR